MSKIQQVKIPVTLMISDKEITDRVKLNGGIYYLKRERDGAGDSGRMLNAINPNTAQVEATGEIIVGCCVQCGSPFAGTYSKQDWWLTTPVTEILKVNEDATEVEFKTGNSIYTIKAR